MLSVMIFLTHTAAVLWKPGPFLNNKYLSTQTCIKALLDHKQVHFPFPPAPVLAQYSWYCTTPPLEICFHEELFHMDTTEEAATRAKPTHQVQTPRTLHILCSDNAHIFMPPKYWRRLNLVDKTLLSSECNHRVHRRKMPDLSTAIQQPIQEGGTILSHVHFGALCVWI